MKPYGGAQKLPKSPPLPQSSYASDPTNVVAALRKTSKGQLKYDPDGFQNIKEELLDLKRRQNSLAFGYPYENFSEIASRKENKDDFKENSDAKTDSEDDGTESSPPDQFEITEERLWDIEIMNYEEQYKERAQRAIDERIRKFYEHYLQLIEDQKRKIKALEEKRNMENQLQREEYLAQLQARNEELVQLQQNQQERLDYSIQLMKAKIKEAERTQKQIDAETQERMLLKKQQENLATTVHQCQKEINLRYHKMVEALRNCSDASLLPDSIKEDVIKYKDVKTVFTRLVNAAKTSSLTSDDVTDAISLVQEFDECIKNIMDAVKKINEAKEQLISEQKNNVKESSMSPYQTADDQSKILGQKLINTQSQALSPQNTDNVGGNVGQTSLQLPASVEKNSEVPKNYSECPDYSFFISPKALKENIILQNFLKSVQNSYQPLQNDTTAAMKKYRFDLQKAVNIPVNAISPLSGQHVKDKLERLRKLLSGHTVDISSSRVSASHHPMAISLCKDLLAKKIVKQGEEQVAAKYEAAFAIAATVIGLWIDFPDFGDLLLAHFHQKCPFIIPFYIPQIEGQTEEEHYKAMGYIYIDGTIEKQDKYLKRMSGIMRLYSAILCTQVPYGMNRPHPHGIEHGWKWMARILNLEPRVDITATMLYDFLETAGFAMEAAYKNQFEKLMYVLCEDYFPKLRRVSVGGTGGPITRLENFLTDYRNNRRIPKPSGMLSQNFWFT